MSGFQNSWQSHPPYFMIYPCFNPYNQFPVFNPFQSNNNAQTTQKEENISEFGLGIILDRTDLEKETYDIKRKPWSEQQDKKLLKLCQNSDLRFEQISEHLSGRNSKMCYSRFRRLTNKSKNQWTSSEDQLLIQLIQNMGKNWNHIISYFPKRKINQLRDHYENSLRPNLDKSHWSIDQDLLLIEYLNKFGKNWKIIEEKMPQRSGSTIKNRYFGKLRKLNIKKVNSNVLQSDVS